MKAVILAAGMGKRMRRADAGATLSERQAAVARTGVKALIPLGRPFLDYVLGGLADAGFSSVCLVIGPDHQQIRDYCARLPLQRISIDCVVQPEPLGTAHALHSAAEWVGHDPCIVLNSDNYYPPAALAALRDCGEDALVGFSPDVLVQQGNIPAERVARFAIVRPDEHGYLQQIVEKPDPQRLAEMPPPVLVSMNCWRFRPAIFRACRSIKPSPRGEYEIPAAVNYSMDRFQCRYRVLRCAQPVLDLSCRQDIAAVARCLGDVEVNL